MTQEQIDKAVRRYNKLASRRDERINRPALDEIAAQLAQVPAGTRNDVDLLLGRPGAVLPERVEYQTQPNNTQAEIDRQQRIYEQLVAVKEVWSTSEQRAEWKDAGAAATAPARRTQPTERRHYSDYTPHVKENAT